MLIFHISDIHIRPNKRVEEYEYIIDKFCNDVVHEEKQDKCVVITGDIFHEKSRIDSPGIYLFYKLLKGLKGINTFIIRGNHDYKQWKKDEIDMISSLLINKDGLEHVHYLNKTGSYAHNEEISFSVLTIQDVLMPGNTNANEKNTNCKFPLPLNTKYKIALFHGTPLYPGMFKEYHYALLGDIHQQKVWKEGKTLCGFAGSFIRQNKGETLEGHGYLKWDLKQKSVKAVDIFNPWVNTTDHEKGLVKINQYNISLPINDLQKINESLLLIDKSGITSGFVQDKIDERNAKIHKKITEFQNIFNTFSHKKSIRFLNMKWNWVLCYGQNNSFDFTKLDNKIISITASNASGKTSFLETIMIALYGSGFPSRTKKEYSASIINSYKPHGAKSNTALILMINSKMYKVYRSFASQDSTNGCTLHTISRSTGIDVFIEDEGWSNICSGKSATDAWIHENIGTQENILLTNILSQNGDNDFFDLSVIDQKNILDNILNIKSFSLLLDIYKESKLAHLYINDLLHNDKKAFKEQIDLKQRLEELCKKQVCTPKWLPTYLEPKEFYQNIINNFDITLYNELLPYNNVSLNYMNLDFNNATRDYKSLKGKFSGNIAKHFDMDEFSTLRNQFEHISNPSFDKGPFNSRCKCCKERQQNNVDIKLWIRWTELRDYYIVSLSNYIRDHLGDYDEFVDAKSILENYDGIQLQFHINEIKSKISYINASGDLNFDQKIEEINTIISCIENDTQTLYEDKIVPVFNDQLNNILDILSCNFKVYHKKTAKGYFEWFIAENNTCIIKASGFQRFALNLAARLALSRIGSINFDQLFIDEGFRTCDEDNLSKIPSFLESLLSLYSSVSVITHLRELKDNIPYSIEILKNDKGISNLIF